MKNRFIFLFSFIAAALLVGIFWFWLFYQSFGEKNLKVYFFDVGQGDASLIRTSGGQNILIDGGSDGRILEELSSYLPFYERRLDLVILTHQHEDHLGGLLEVFKRYQVDNVIYSSASGSPALAAAWLKALADEKAQIIKPPFRLKTALGFNCFLEVFNPSYFYHGQDLNQYSLVSKLDCGAKVLLTGDAGKAVEEYFLKNNFDLSADILKVGHHGSVSASSVEFLEAVSPSWAVISVGAGNRYNLPAPEIERRLLGLGIFLRRTDKSGTIIAEYGEEQIKLKP